MMRRSEPGDLTGPQRRLPAALGALAGLLLAVSLAFPYWQARLFAPQYRQGLTATMFAHKLTGDIQEIDLLNHYIGMTPLGELAVWERRLAIPGVAALALWAVLSFWRLKRVPPWLKALPLVAFPAVFMADMAWWMTHATADLDPTAPLKLKPFSIPVLGTGKVAQFRSELGPMAGFYLAAAAALLAVVAAWLERARSKKLKTLAAAVVAASMAGGARAASLQERVDAASDGAVLELEAGVHEGPVVVSKRLTLRGREGAVIDGLGRGTVVKLSAEGAALENVLVRGSGESLAQEDAGARLEAASTAVRDCRFEDVLFGVFLANAPGAAIERNRFRGKPLEAGRRGDLIRSWNSDRVLLSGNVVEGGRDVVLWFSTGSVVEGNEVRGGRYGLHFMYTNGAVVRRNRFEDNSVGLYVMYSRELLIEGNRFERHRGPSGSGLGLKESDSVAARDNVFAGNRQGVFIDQSPLLEENTNRFERNVFAGNDVGVALTPGSRGNVFAENSFEENLQQVSVRGGGKLSGNDWSRGGRGNHWSDYAGWTRRGAETGAVPFRLENAVEGLIDRRPLARFFLWTPAATALEAAARAFPVFKAQPILVDPHPLVRPPVRPPAERRPGRGLGAAAALLGLSAAALALMRGRRAPLASPVTAIPAGHPAGKEKAAACLVRVESVSKSFGGKKVLEGVSFELAPGHALALWGANGTGKSTLLKCLLGLMEFEGAITMGSLDVRREGERSRGLVGYVPQEPACHDATVEESLELVCRLRRVDRRRGAAALERVGLGAEAGKPVPALSGGMRQRLALAAALVADPPLLLLDEPCANLDAKARSEFSELVEGLRGERSLIVATHRVEEVAAWADRVLELSREAGPRLVPLESFMESFAARTPLWLELERRDATVEAIERLRLAGWGASKDGVGLWVEAKPGSELEPIRHLEAGGLKVRRLKREGSI